MENTAPLHGRLTRLAEIRSQHQSKSATQIAITALAPGLPTFFHFTNYHTMPGRIDFADLAEPDAGTGQPGAGGLQAARALVKLAGTKPEALADENYEMRRGELDAVQIDLTRQVNEYWRQNPHLQVLIDVDKETVQTAQGRRPWPESCT